MGEDKKINIHINNTNKDNDYVDDMLFDPYEEYTDEFVEFEEYEEPILTILENEEDNLVIPAHSKPMPKKEKNYNKLFIAIVSLTSLVVIVLALVFSSWFIESNNADSELKAKEVESQLAEQYSNSMEEFEKIESKANLLIDNYNSNHKYSHNDFINAIGELEHFKYMQQELDWTNKYSKDSKNRLLLIEGEVDTIVSQLKKIIEDEYWKELYTYLPSQDLLNVDMENFYSANYMNADRKNSLSITAENVVQEKLEDAQVYLDKINAIRDILDRAYQDQADYQVFAQGNIERFNYEAGEMVNVYEVLYQTSYTKKLSDEVNKKAEEAYNAQVETLTKQVEEATTQKLNTEYSKIVEEKDAQIRDLQNKNTQQKQLIDSLQNQQRPLQ